ncbi:hypothetical protein EOE18_14745 [Novosphingobium umbonatum]|uniref:Uncharacterized protein n=1 Tax=Novosphingobium umbonatum TaxID=1908524 RepID=A0A437N0X9_9SPHN|nr:hypothetical protein [Novosphingobium umbonatum]RVU03578.1 hypothetical protein EOE18_14745 [Novosphingobium umbonatum]
MKFPKLRLIFERHRYKHPIKARISFDRTSYNVAEGRRTVFSIYVQFPLTDYVASLQVTR